MRGTWILIANASHALCLQRDDGTGSWTPLAQFEHPEGRAKGTDLISDRAGYVSAHHRAGASFNARTAPKQHEQEVFAHRIANYLNQGVASHQCDALAIIASNPFLGEVKASLDEQAQKATVKTVAKDLTSFYGEDLSQRIDDALTRH